MSTSDPDRLARELAALAEDCRRHAGLAQKASAGVTPLIGRTHQALAGSAAQSDQDLTALLTQAAKKCRKAESALSTAMKEANSLAAHMRQQAARARDAGRDRGRRR